MQKKQYLYAIFFLSICLGAYGMYQNTVQYSYQVVFTTTETITTQPRVWDMNANKIHDDLDRKLASMKANDYANIVVSSSSLASLKAVLSSYSYVVTNTYPAIHAMAIKVPIRTVDLLSHDSRITQIEDANFEFQATLDGSLTIEQVPTVWTEYGYHGENQVVAVIDTGIDNSHQDLADQGTNYKVIAFRDITNSAKDDFTVPIAAYDDQGHGTHCAGIIAGTGAASSGTYKGAAYGAKLIGVKVLTSSGSGTEANVLAGMQWCIDNMATYGIDVVSMSLGSNSATASDGTDSISQMADSIVNAGMVLCVAAGNHGTPAYLYGYNTIGSPAASKNAITIGSITNTGAWSTFSNEGPTGDGRIKPDVMAVGSDVTSIKANSGNQYVSMSGTSMATPTAAGICAILRQAAPTKSPAEIKTALMKTALDKGTTGADNTYGSGIIQTKACIQELQGSVDSPPTCSITAPTSGAVISGTYQITVAATDDKQISKVEVQIAGSWIDITANYASNVYYYNWDTTAVTDGSYTIAARATDSNLQTTSATSVSVTVQNTVTPNITYVASITVTVTSYWFFKNAKVSVQVWKAASTPIGSGAAVTVALTKPSGSITTKSANTASTGIASISFTYLTTSGTYIARVTNIVYTGYTYDASKNIITQKSFTI